MSNNNQSQFKLIDVRREKNINRLKYCNWKTLIYSEMDSDLNEKLKLLKVVHLFFRKKTVPLLKRLQIPFE